MDIIIKDEKDNSEKKLWPITLTRPAHRINVGGFDLISMLKAYFPECKIKCSEFDEGVSKNVIEISSCTVPSLNNMRKIKEGAVNKLDIIEFPHQTIIWNKKICSSSLEFMAKENGFKKMEGYEDVYLKEDIEIHENIVMEGLVVIDSGVKISPFTYIKGPVYIGKGTKIIDHASIKENVVIGELCKIGGEVEESVIMSFSNKQHHGFLGNSFVGSWVNLGAGTSNSDLKNTYGEIKVGEINSGEQFLGCVIGDFSKTAINSSIYTGKIIGVNCALYGNVVKDIPSFVNLNHAINLKNSEYDIDQAIKTQKRTFLRRNKEQIKEDIDMLKKIFKETLKERKEFFKK